tara:strand:+ start:29 stop:487 length:459 start_codon:yes stop_codon:yes gene_type:complete
MAKKGISKEHRKFIQLVADGESQMDAYVAIIRNSDTTIKTATEQGSRLAKKYAKEIDELIKEDLMVISKAKEKAALKTQELRIMSKAERMAFLTKVVEVDKENVYMTDKIRSIAELNKMDGSYAPEKVETKDTTFTKEERKAKIKALKDKMK